MPVHKSAPERPVDSDETPPGGDLSEAELIAAIRQQLVAVYSDILHQRPPPKILLLLERLEEEETKGRQSKPPRPGTPPSSS